MISSSGEEGTEWLQFYAGSKFCSANNINKRNMENML